MVDALIDYNLPQGQIWMYEMKEKNSSTFWMIKFPHWGNNVTINQLFYHTLDPIFI